MKVARGWTLLFTKMIAMISLVAVLHSTAAGTVAVTGVIFNEDGPVPGARVRVRATENLTFTDADGRFELADLEAGQPVEVAAWSSGHYIASVIVTPPSEGVTLTLRPYHTTDNPDYAWTLPAASSSEGACGNCHPMIMPQWSGNAHGQAVANPRFFSLYDGTNLSGTQVVTPGYQLDFPGTAGNCANCHAPGAAVDGYLTTNMDSVRGVITAGIHCDYCHKVGGVYLNPATGSVYPNSPGVQGQRVLRPPAGDNIFFGPYDDIHDPDTYLPLIAESEYCATCHQFSFWGTPIYESFDEWLASPYAAAGVTCQDCHMPPNGDEYFALPSVGGLPHPPEQIPSHLQLGASDIDLLQESVSLTVSSEQYLDQLRVTVDLTNVGAGHHLPTDFPGRNLILVVSARTIQGEELSQIMGSTVPIWGGREAGLPGKGFAKILQDPFTLEAPVVSYWQPTFILSDNRLAALESDRSGYTFALPSTATLVDVEVRLFFRRLFQPLAEERGWQMPELEIAFTAISVEIEPAIRTYLPIIRH